MTAAVNELSGRELMEHLELTLTINVWEMHMLFEDWSDAQVYGEMLRMANLRAGDLSEHIAFGPPLLTDVSTGPGERRAELLTYPLTPEGKALSPVVSCASEQCTCFMHRSQPCAERKPHSMLTWPEGW